jgi:phosphate transport system substrate-binding protein
MKEVFARRSGITNASIMLVVLIIGAAAVCAAYFDLSGSSKTSVTTITETSTIVSSNTSISIPSMVMTSTATSTSSTLFVSLQGAGGTLVYPVMTYWTFGFNQISPNIQISYDAVGSGAGIKAITADSVNFGESDAPLTSAQYSALNSTLVTLPISASAVVPAYNLPGISNGLNFTGAVLARIFLGNITMWNDPAIQDLNPGVILPYHPIQVIHRSDGSGTMFAFTDYLSDSSSQWRTQVGKSTLPPWPVGLGCKGNEGVANCIANNQYSIGPLELSYEITDAGLISYGAVENAAGNFILANLSNAQLAVEAGGSTGLPAGNEEWTNVSIIDNIFNDTQATFAYPITTFTYALLYQQQTNDAAGEALVSFLWWIVNSGQDAGTSIGYVPLPANVVQLDDASLNSITFDGSLLHLQSGQS